MGFTREQRQELNTLSKQVFGKSSFWYNKLYKTGVKKLTKAGLSDWRYFTSFEDIKEYILTIQKNSQELLEKMKADADTNGNSK